MHPGLSKSLDIMEIQVQVYSGGKKCDHTPPAEYLYKSLRLDSKASLIALFCCPCLPLLLETEGALSHFLAATGDKG